jgi:hypothetical protein
MMERAVLATTVLTFVIRRNGMGLYAYLPDGLLLIVPGHHPTGIELTDFYYGREGLACCLVARESLGIGIQDVLDEGDEGGEVCYRSVRSQTTVLIVPNHFSETP